jgi:predicted CXXCH cytochrome family protein
MLWPGCTVTRANYATLSFFFDGVPNPDAPARGGGEPGDATMAAAVIVHRPFAEEKCETCHKTQYRPSRNDPAACLSCHETVMNQHAWTHGAVAGGACLWCHAPHESARKWLLRGPDRGICVQCHSATMLTGETVPAHADPKTSCIACHFAHGGENAIMLRPGATAQSPPPEAALEPDKPSDANAPTFGRDLGGPKDKPQARPEARPEAKPEAGPEAGPGADPAADPDAAEGGKPAKDPDTTPQGEPGGADKGATPAGSPPPEKSPGPTPASGKEPLPPAQRP